MSILVSSPNLAKVSTKVSSLFEHDHDGENRREKIAGESQRYDFVISLYNFFYAIVAVCEKNNGESSTTRRNDFVK